MKKTISMILVMAGILIFSSQSYAYERAIKQISSAIMASLANSGKTSIGVIDFMDLQGNINELGRFIAEEISVDLTTSAKNIQVVDRLYLKNILREHMLSVSGLVDPKTTKKLGQISGIGAIVTGAVTPFGETIRITCKIIATDTAKVIGAAKGEIPRTQAIEGLMAKEIENDSDQSPLRERRTGPSIGTLSPNKRAVQGTKDVSVELLGCTIKGNIIRVDFVLVNKTSREIERYLDIKNIYLIGEGEQYTATRISFGGKIDTFVRPQLVSNVPERGYILFEGIPRSPTQIDLGIHIFGGNPYNEKLLFKNIPVRNAGQIPGERSPV